MAFLSSLPSQKEEKDDGTSLSRKMAILLAGFLVVTLALTAGSYSLTAGASGREWRKPAGALSRKQPLPSKNIFPSSSPDLRPGGFCGGPSRKRFARTLAGLFGRFLESARIQGVQNVFMGFETGGFTDATLWVPPGGYDPRIRSWYVEALKKESAVVTSPYRDLITGELIVSVTAPVITPSGELLGVFGLDVNMAHVREKVVSRKVFGEGDGFLVDRKGFFLASPFPEWDLSESIVIPSAAVPSSLSTSAKALLLREPGTALIPFRGESAMLFHSPAGEHFTLGMILPERVFRRFVQDIAALHLFGGFVILLLASVLLFPRSWA